MEKVIEVKNLTKEYKEQKAVDNLSFDVYEGDKIEANKKSVAISIVLRNKEKTLDEKEINSAIEKILATISKDYNGEIRQ